jgi:hypothetical protein
MSTCDTLRAYHAATAIAYQAKCGGVVPGNVEALVGFVAESLAADHPARLAVDAFAKRYAIARRDPVALAEAGDALQTDVIRALRPVPVDQSRVDIHG